MAVLLETSLGDLVVDLLCDDAPDLCRNFLKLCALKYYNDCLFFRVERGFIVQTGDPTNTGGGGASAAAAQYGAQAAHFARPPRPAGRRGPPPSHARRGTLSMTGGARGFASQFFITLADGLDYLDAAHAPFGAVAEGLHVLDRFAAELVDADARPYRTLRVRHTVVLHDPFPDPPAFPDPRPESPPPAQGPWGDLLPSDADDELSAGVEALAAVREAREARSRAEVLEMLGDIGDADDRPPENVLFVCKLNPCTLADDLEIIFSRFGECRADVLRDPRTGDSLCYGFIEYESKEQAEKAFFKLDNCLIDDRRVRVDFSQSVSRLWNDRRRSLKKGRAPGHARPDARPDARRQAQRR